MIVEVSSDLCKWDQVAKKLKKLKISLKELLTLIFPMKIIIHNSGIILPKKIVKRKNITPGIFDGKPLSLR